MKKRSKAGLFVVLAVAALLSAGVSRDTSARTDAPRSRIDLETTSFTVKTWQTDGSHMTEVKGRLTYDGKPVAHAVLQSDLNKRLLRTEDDGSFGLHVDRSLLVHTPVRVVSAEEANISGKPLGRKEAKELLSASAAITVYYPIRVLEAKPDGADAGKVRVSARIMSEPGGAVSFFKVDKYRIAGRVEDADGNPVKGAFVWIDRDRGEGFAKSTPTDRDGKYEMFYWPEEEDTHLTVIAGTRRYTLPEGKVFVLPRNTSADIRIRLPRTGTVIDDKPPMLVSTTTQGATYTGLLAGLDVPPEVRYTVTIPDRDGRFVLTVPQEIWARRPTFFETRLTKFVGREKALKAGDTLPAGFVQPNAHDPRIVASLP